MKRVTWIKSGSSSPGPMHKRWTVEQISCFLKKFTIPEGSYKDISSVIFVLSLVVSCNPEPGPMIEALEKAGYSIKKPANVDNPMDYKVKISLNNVYEIEGIREKVHSLRVLMPIDGYYFDWERTCVRAITKQTNNWYMEKDGYTIAWDCIADEILNELGFILSTKTCERNE